jgi:nicotinate-nucleotide adenylyltransferase
MSTLTGVMGGMFDPVHLAHLQAARRAREHCGLQQVLLVPCGNPVHRGPAQADAAQRCNMLRLALQDQPGLQLDTRECDSAAPSRTFDTLAALRAERPEEVLCLILGMDAFLSLASWYRWRELFGLAQFIVITRPGYSLGAAATSQQAEVLQELARRRIDSPAALAQGKAGSILLLEAETPQLSSSQIRERLQAGESVRELLPPAVADWIDAQQLYRAA